MAEIEIRSLFSLDEMYEAVELQRIYWGNDIESLVPAHMLLTIAQTGGQVIAAFHESKMVGILVGIIGVDLHQPDRPAMANLLVYSKRMVVLPEFRSYGIATQLKFAQRDLTMKLGIRLVMWTFDPLLARNAHLNLRKLGAISRRYVDDYYGKTPHGGLATLGFSDRLSLEWWVNSHRVAQRFENSRGGLSLENYLDGGATIVNLAQYTDGYPQPPETFQEVPGAFGLLEVPLEYPTIVENNETLAISWREHTRSAFHTLLDQGFIVTDFVRGTYDDVDRGFYVLSFGVTDITE